MRLYEGSVEQFRQKVAANLMADELSEQYRRYYRRNVSASEYRAWQNSFNFLKNAFDLAPLGDNRLIVEYELPYTVRRIDALVFGRNLAERDNIVLLELKQWSNDGVRDCTTEGNVLVDFGHGVVEVPHPSFQVEGYHFDLKDFLAVFEERDAPELSSCVFCHNYSRLSPASVLFSKKFHAALGNYPIFAKEDVNALGAFLREKLGAAPGVEVFHSFVTSTLKPSKKLIEHVREMINSQQIFTLIDDQIAAYNAVMHRAKKLAESGDKGVIIVKGGPGTGKSVIALEVMGELYRQGKTVFHATGSSAFTKTLRHILGRRLTRLFAFFFAFTRQPPNSIDVIICDEAHRLRAHSNDYGVPAQFRSRAPQVDDLIRPAKLSVFFIDEQQVVRPKEIGSVRLIREAAMRLGIREHNISEFELKTQFRCSGSDAYLQWIEDVLGIRRSESPKFDPRMEFRIFDDPHRMMGEIRARNREKANCARIVAGFCWRWSDPLPDGTLVRDVKIGDFEMPWEKKNEFWKWATDDSGMEQVGTVYTAQGFEFDYIGVIFGEDLVYDTNRGEWVAVPEKSFDTQVTRGNPDLVNHLKHVYRVLMSRAHKGVYVYFIDAGTRRFFENRLSD